ncbi:spermidine synthase [Variovorax sp. CF079]|uniref:fused MFS/spermidine synthase n=1 Tax=Variovorax sp. CF079 TaxID=1882774 RepID=UPI000889F6BD|nr:fused MFS/spermidine synthase [Variovorax sp. CF079]SDE48083.1 spermidine synthase [Variovorax sp. CF079]
MSDSSASAQHVKPFIYETVSSKALHFCISHTQSRMRLSDPYALALEYTRTMMGFLLFKPEPRSIGMIGLGGGSLAKFCYRHLSRARIQIAEINSMVIALREEFHIPRDDARFIVFQSDGADFVRRGSSRFDVLIVDGYDLEGLPAQLSSQSFYDDCRETLQPDGIMVVNLQYGDPETDEHLARIRRSFNGSVLVVDDGEESHSIVFACKGDALETYRLGAIRRPPDLDPGAASQLLAGFALIASVLKDQRS